MKTLFTLALMTLSLAAQAEHSMDRKLTRAEMQKLLPEYVRMVESSAATLLSADENQTYVNAGSDYAYTLWDGTKAIGLQQLTAAQKIEMLERVLATLKEGTAASRQEEAAMLLEGFKGSREAGKVSCRLGYWYSSKVANERIVVCTDNRSQAGSEDGEDEGYLDIRTFILSIDASTLAPLSLLKLQHDIAG